MSVTPAVRSTFRTRMVSWAMTTMIASMPMLNAAFPTGVSAIGVPRYCAMNMTGKSRSGTDSHDRCSTFAEYLLVR